MNDLHRWLFMNWHGLQAFPDKIADELKERGISSRTARAVGPGRIQTLDDVARLAGMKCDKERQTLEELAKKFPQFSLEGVVGLATMKIGVKDVRGYQGAGIGTADDMLKTHSEGLTMGELIPHYTALGVTSVALITSMQQANVLPSEESAQFRRFIIDNITGYHRNPYLIGDYRRLGIKDEDMPRLASAGVGPDEVKKWGEILRVEKLDERGTLTFLTYGITSVDEMVEIGNAIRSGGGRMLDSKEKETFIKYRAVGVANEREMRALGLSEVAPGDVALYRLAGVEKVQDMMLLSTHGCRPEAAQILALLAGFRGKVGEMVALADAGLVTPAEATHDRRGEIWGYVGAGLNGNADQMIRLLQAGIPGKFASAHSLLLDGDKPTSQEKLADAIIAAYRPERADAGPGPARQSS